MYEAPRGFWGRWHSRLMQSSQSRFAMAWLFLISFLESSVSPIPPDIIFVPMILANPKNAWRVALISTAGSLVGGLVGYGIGYYLFHWIGERILEMYHMQAAFEHFRHDLNRWGFWIISLKGLTPVPFKIVTLGAGIAHFKLPSFLLASLIARSFRFFLLSYAIKAFGPGFAIIFEKYFAIFVLLVIAMIVGSFVLIGYMY